LIVYVKLLKIIIIHVDIINMFFDNDSEYKDEAIEALPYIKKILNKLQEHSGF